MNGQKGRFGSLQCLKFEVFDDADAVVFEQGLQLELLKRLTQWGQEIE